jgi:hypothetical protein
MSQVVETLNIGFYFFEALIMTVHGQNDVYSRRSSREDHTEIFARFLLGMCRLSWPQNLCHVNLELAYHIWTCVYLGHVML